MKKRAMTILLTLLLMFGGWTAFVPQTAYAAFSGIIKVRISPSGQSSDIRVVPHGKYFISEAQTVQLKDAEYKVHLSGSKVQLKSGSTVLYSGPKLTLVRASGNTEANFIVFPYSPTQRTRTNYYGNIEFSVNAGLCAVNHVYVEDYVMGVIPYEMSPSWPANALKAQAVCARNYGVRAALASPSGTWHLGDTASSQVYRGVPGVGSAGTIDYSTYNKIKSIIDGTSRKVMRYNGDVFSAFFSAWNGGETLSVPGWTGNTSSAYGYTAVKPDPYDDRRCQNSYWIARTVNTSLYSPTGSDVNMAVQNMLVREYREQYGVTAANVYVVSTAGIKGLDPSGAPEVSLVYEKFYCYVKFNTSSAAKKITFTDTDLKAALGISSAYGAFRIVNNSNGTTTLYNVRYGHGVGMSQRGAQQMANEGMGYTDILRFYYNGITFSTLAVSPPSLPSMPDQGTTTDTKQAYFGTVVNCNSYVNVRSRPSTSAAKAGKALKGAKYSVKKAYYTTAWHQIDYNGKTAYVHKDYFALTKQSASSAPVGKATRLTYVYKTASTASTKLLKLETGNLMDVPSVSGKYYKVRAVGKTGYVPVSRVTIVAGTVSPTPLPTTTPAVTKTPAAMATQTPEKTAAPAQGTTTNTKQAYIGAVVNCNSYVNVRSRPATSAAKAGKALKGAKYIVKKAHYTKTWHQIDYNGKTAYIHKAYLSVSKQSASSRPVGKATRLTYVYKSASTSSKKLLKLGKGNLMDVLSVSGKYYKVRAVGKTGYVPASRVTIVAGKVAGSSTPRLTTTPAATRTPEKTAAPAQGTTTNTKQAYIGAVVNCNSYVNVRSRPATSAAKAGKALKGAKYIVKKANYTKTWHQIDYNGKTAYIHKAYLSLSKLKASSKPVGKATRLTYVYKSASTSSKKLLKLGKGNLMDVLSVSGKYYKVRAVGKTGYVPVSRVTVISGKVKST